MKKAPTTKGLKESTLKPAITTAAMRKGQTAEEFVHEVALASGRKLKEADRMAKRFSSGGGTPECVKQHLLSLQQ